DRDARLCSAKDLALSLGDIARRLTTDPAELDRTPRRRATDRLPVPEERQSLAEAGLPLGIRFWHGLGLPVPSRGTVALVAAAAGLALGLGVGSRLAAPAPVVIHTGGAPQPAALVAATEPLVTVDSLPRTGGTAAEGPLSASNE